MLKENLVFLLDPKIASTESLDELSLLWRHIADAVLGIYFEDEDLFRLAELPFAQEISNLGQMKISTQTFNFSMQERRSQIEKLFSLSMKNSWRVKSQFIVERGWLDSDLVKLINGAEFLVICRHLNDAQLLYCIRHHTDGHILFINEPWRKGNCVVGIIEDYEAQTGMLKMVDYIGDRLNISKVLGIANMQSKNIESGFTQYILPKEHGNSANLIDFVQSLDARVVVWSAKFANETQIRDIYQSTQSSCLLIKDG